MKRALFPGSSDPIMSGHLDIIRRALVLFDEIAVVIDVNDDKNYMFTVEQRKEFIEKAFVDEPKVKVSTYQGLTADYRREIDVQFVLRGLHNLADFEFEKAITRTSCTPSKIEIVFLLTIARTSSISLSIVRDVIRNNGDYTVLVSESVRV